MFSVIVIINEFACALADVFFSLVLSFDVYSLSCMVIGIGIGIVIGIGVGVAVLVSVSVMYCYVYCHGCCYCWY